MQGLRATLRCVSGIAVFSYCSQRPPAPKMVPPHGCGTHRSRTALRIKIPSRILLPSDSAVEKAAAEEQRRGLSSLLGRGFTIVSDAEGPTIGWIEVGSLSRNPRKPAGEPQLELGPEEFFIRDGTRAGIPNLVIIGGTPQAELYGVYHLLEEVAS